MSLIERVRAKKGCGASDRDTDENDVGNSAGRVNGLCQSLNFVNNLFRDGGRERERSPPDIGATAEQVSSTIPGQSSRRVSPWWRCKRSNKVLKSSTSECGASCCSESVSRRTRLARTAARTSTPSSSCTSEGCSARESNRCGEGTSWAQ